MYSSNPSTMNCNCVTNVLGPPPQFNLTRLPMFDDDILREYLSTLLILNSDSQQLLLPTHCNIETVNNNFNNQSTTTNSQQLYQSHNDSTNSIMAYSSTYAVLVAIVVLIVVVFSLLVLTLVSVYVFKQHRRASKIKSNNVNLNANDATCFHQLCVCARSKESTSDSCITMSDYVNTSHANQPLNKSLFTISSANPCSSSSMSTLKSTVSDSTRTSSSPQQLQQQQQQQKQNRLRPHSQFQPVAANSSISSSTSASPVQPYQTSDCLSNNHYYESIPDLSQYYFDCEFDQQQQHYQESNSDYCYGKSYNCRTVQMNILQPALPPPTTSNKRQPIVTQQSSLLFNSHYLRGQII